MRTMVPRSRWIITTVDGRVHAHATQKTGFIVGVLGCGGGGLVRVDVGVGAEGDGGVSGGGGDGGGVVVVEEKVGGGVVGRVGGGAVDGDYCEGA